MFDFWDILIHFLKEPFSVILHKKILVKVFKRVSSFCFVFGDFEEIRVQDPIGKQGFQQGSQRKTFSSQQCLSIKSVFLKKILDKII